MVANEQYFPRGGKKPKTQLSSNKNFDFLATADKIGKKRRYKAPKQLAKDEEAVFEDTLVKEQEHDPNSGLKMIYAESLSENTIQVGMCILGRVQKAEETKLTISLPGRIIGIAMACHISEPHTKQLQAFVNGTVEDIKQLPDVFKVGEYVPVRVINVQVVNNFKKVTLSLKPQDVNKQYSHVDLKLGMLTRGAVESVEDHGYVIDLGIPNCRTFLPQNQCDKDTSLNVGQVIWCVIKKCEISGLNATVKVSNKLSAVRDNIISGDKISSYKLSDLNPGMALDFFVEKSIGDGAEGTFLNNSTGYIHVSQIGTKIPIGKSVKARLLYTTPLTKLAFFTTRNVFPNADDDSNDDVTLKIGDIIDDAKVMRVNKKTIIFKVDGKAVAIMPQSMSADPYKFQDIKDHYQPGSSHKIRIIKYYPSDYAYHCTDSEDVLNEKYFSYNDLNIGDIIDVTVEKVADPGVSVTLGKLKGWMSKLHASDTPQFALSENCKQSVSFIMKKFKVGAKIRARVLQINQPSQLYVTSKSSLLSDDFTVLSQYEDAIVDSMYRGVVVQHFQTGILVGFFGDVKGFIPSRLMSSEGIENIPEAFPLGQIVNCYVSSVDLPQRKMTCSLLSKKEVKNKSINAKTGVNVDKNNKKLSIKENKADESSNIEKKNKKRQLKEVEESANETSLQSPSAIETKKKKKDKNKSATIEPTEVVDKKSKKRKIEEEIKPDNSIDIDEDEEKPKPSTDIASSAFSSMTSFWNTNNTTISQRLNTKEEVSSDSEDEKIEEAPKKKKKLSASEKVEKARQEEEKLRSIERQVAANDNAPQSSDQFDRLLLADPNKSEVWIAYMAFHLQATEIDKARSVGQKAIKTISFREEEEKLNVWCAMLNLEIRFGSEESLKLVLDEALQMNEPFKVHSKLLSIYVDTQKTEPLISLVDKMISKYRTDPKTYIMVGEACYKLKLVEKARSVMQKAMNRLDKKVYVPVLIKFAHMENNNGDTERAEALFEQILSCLPQRVDVWCVYSDMLIKSFDYEKARSVFERATSQKVSVKKMKVLYKKWIDMEEKLGNQEQIESVRQMALQYIEKAMK